MVFWQMLEIIPKDWELLTVRGKAPYELNWNERQFSRDYITQELWTGRATGFALKTSEKLVALDIDDEEMIKKICPKRPKTISFRGQKNRRQELYYSEVEISRKILVPGVEIRGRGCISVLPPSWHPITKQKYQWIESPLTAKIAPLPKQIQKLINEIPTPPTIIKPQTRRGNTTTIQLEYCLSLKNRHRLNYGVNIGERNIAGFELACDAIGVGKYLQDLNINFDPQDVKILLIEFNYRCNPPLSEKEINQIWRSANSRHRTPSCPPEIIEKFFKKWN